MAQIDYELIIFDWDGTLVDSTSSWAGMYQQLIQDIGLPERSPHHLRELAGESAQDVLARLFPDMGQARLRRRLSHYRHRYGWQASTPRLFDGVRQALHELRAADCWLAVATGRHRRGLDRDMQITETADLFRITRCADESASKPAPDMVEDILLRTATEPSAAVMVGDTEYDVAMANAAGVDAVAVCSRIHDQDRLLQAGALAVIDNVAGLPRWLA